MDYADTTTAYRVKKAITGYKATMKHEEEIYNKKLTVKNLTKAETFLKEAETVIEKEQDNYADISEYMKEKKSGTYKIWISASKDMGTWSEGRGEEPTR